MNARSIWSRAVDVASLVATPLAPSHYLALVAPLAATHALKARVEAVHDEAGGARTLVLRPGRGWRGHAPGQYAKIDVAVDGRLASRTYSISSSAERGDARFAITVKPIAGGRVSNHLARAVRPGDTLGIAPAQGDFVLPDPLPARILFVTAGSGITPVMSMLRTLRDRGAMPDVVHVHYAPRARDAIFGRELAKLAETHGSYRLVMNGTREPGAARFSARELDAIAPDWRAREAWACGPAALLDAIGASFASADRASALHVERFRPSLAPPCPGAAGGRVRFGLSQRDVESDGATSLLDVAERSGVRAPHGCRMGICHSCDATLVAGCVRDLRTGETVDSPGARVQVCVCAAAGDVEIAL